MGSMVSVNVRMDEDLKNQFETTINNLGLNMTTAINVFAKAVVRADGIPFELSNKIDYDDYFNRANMAAIRRSLKQAEEGDVYRFNSFEELEAFTKNEIEKRK